MSIRIFFVPGKACFYFTLHNNKFFFSSFPIWIHNHNIVSLSTYFVSMYMWMSGGNKEREKIKVTHLIWKWGSIFMPDWTYLRFSQVLFAPQKKLCICEQQTWYFLEAVSLGRFIRYRNIFRIRLYYWERFFFILRTSTNFPWMIW